jgi:TolB protein
LIAFERSVTSVEGVDLFLVRPHGRGLRRLTYRGGAAPDWSPDGKRVAFQRRHNIYVMRASGGGLRRLTYRGGSDPAWSPDGRWVAFVRGGLYAVRTNGRGPRRLLAPEPTRQANVETYFRGPDWQPLRRRRSVGGGGE